MLKIKILGSGCPNCKRLEQETRKAAENLAIEAEFEKGKKQILRKEKEAERRIGF